jgi:hypothetical protein
MELLVLDNFVSLFQTRHPETRHIKRNCHELFDFRFFMNRIPLGP